MTKRRIEKLLVIIPAWNEEDSIGQVIREIREIPLAVDIIVVNDCSSDNTSKIARDHGVGVIDLPVNLGVGGAMRTGFCYARNHDYDAAIQVDADGQHDPREISTLVDGMIDMDANLVIGARFAGKGSYRASGPRRWAMSVLSKVLSRVTGTKLTDSTSGFKIVDRNAISVFAKDFPSEYLGDTIESLVIAARSHLTVRQVPVEMRERSGGRPSHNPLRAALFLARASLALIVALGRPSSHRASFPKGVQQ